MAQSKMARYKAAIIGLGRIASTIDDEVIGTSIQLPYGHMGCYRDVPDVEVVAAADTYPEQRDAFLRRWGHVNLYDDYAEMLVRERPDIVSICTSAKPRAQIIEKIAGLNAGVRFLWAEKPIAISLAEADAIINACHAAGIRVAVNTSRRWDGWYSMARALIDDGQLGRVLQVTAYAEANISHNGSHVLDTVRYLAGGAARASWVVGEMESDEKAATDDDLRGNGYIAFEDGVRAYVRMMPSGTANWTFEVLGERGNIRIANVNDGPSCEWWTKVDGIRSPVQRPFPVPQRMHSPGSFVVRDIVRALDVGGETKGTAEDARAALEIAIALRESHRQGGRWIALPLADRSLKINSAETLRGDLPRAIARRQESHG